MIDYLGWRDATHEGGIGIYRDHALIMVNYGAGNAAGVLSLATKIMQSVENEFQIALEIEPSLIGLPAA
jgi:UDP-N-acetylmuramate dehydrogenase